MRAQLNNNDSLRHLLEDGPVKILHYNNNDSLRHLLEDGLVKILCYNSIIHLHPQFPFPSGRDLAHLHPEQVVIVGQRPHCLQLIHTNTHTHGCQSDPHKQTHRCQSDTHRQTDVNLIYASTQTSI